MAESSLIALLVISKHCDHMPLYRQQPMLARSDIHLPVSTMADVNGRAGAALTPQAESLHRMLVLYADETPLQILDTKKAVKPAPANCELMSVVKKVALLSSASTISPAGAGTWRHTQQKKGPRREGGKIPTGLKSCYCMGVYKK